jgi:hypothetical protein
MVAPTAQPRPKLQTQKSEKGSARQKSNKATRPEEILQKVLERKGSGATASPVLAAVLTVDLRRRSVRPVDEKPPSDRSVKKFVMDQDVLPFGRASDWMAIKDAGVSRCHGEFVRQPDGSYCVRDVGSANGIYVNGSKVEAGELHQIRPGDEITIGFWHQIHINWGT